MLKAFERRLRAVEIANARGHDGEVWIELRDGMMRGPRGERITRVQFEAARSGFVTVVLPDNGRDDQFYETYPPPQVDEP
jgi:hypothetical protein